MSGRHQTEKLTICLDVECNYWVDISLHGQNQGKDLQLEML